MFGLAKSLRLLGASALAFSLLMGCQAQVEYGQGGSSRVRDPRIVRAIEGLRYEADLQLERRNAENLHDTLEKLYKLLEVGDGASAQEISEILRDKKKYLSEDDFRYFSENELSGKELGDHEVVLTFDDGPMRAYTPKIVSELEKYHFTATFFEVGKMVKDSPDITRMLSKHGFLVANHSWDHSNFTHLSDELIKNQVSSTTREIKAALGFDLVPQLFQIFFDEHFAQAWGRARKVSGPEFFRTPYGGRSRRVLELIRKFKTGETCTGANCETSHLMNVMWLIDSIDYGDQDPQRIARRIFNQLNLFHNRGIILMHDIHPQTVQAVRLILPRLVAEGYKVKSMYDALRAMQDHPLGVDAPQASHYTSTNN